MSSLSQFFSSGQKVQIFTTSGVWSCPTPNTKVHVLAIGGGGNGYGAMSVSDGGSSSFGALLSAVGGSAAIGGTGGLGFNVGQLGLPGSGGQGGVGLYGFGSGGNGVGYGAPSGYGGGGGGSGYVSTYSGIVSTDQVVTVGAGGGSGVNRGGSGAVIVWWE